MQHTDHTLAQRKISSSAWEYEAPGLTVAGQPIVTTPAAADYVTLVEVLEITRPFEEFAAAAQAATQRLEREGVRALVRIHFYIRPGSAEVGAILTFSDRERMINHINLISAWDEFKTFFGMVKPLDVRVYGQLNAEAATWIRQFGDQVISRTFEQHVAGFVRPHG
jgi:hypothetical protein